MLYKKSYNKGLNIKFTNIDHDHARDSDPRREDIRNLDRIRIVERQSE